MRHLPLFIGLGIASLVRVNAQEQMQAAAVESLVQAEQAFARASLAKGVRAAFLEFFADDGVLFTPAPTLFKDFVKKTPAPAEGNTMQLNWEPHVADVSLSGDLGYTTGPYARTDSVGDKPPQYGQYLSVWKRRRGGAWKVAVDFGVRTTIEVAPLGRKEVVIPPRDSKRTGRRGFKGGAAGITKMKSLDTQLSAACASAGMLAAYEGVLDGSSRVHRMQRLPIVGMEAIRAWLAGDSSVVVWSPVGAGAAQAGDLGYSYGAYSRRSSRQNVDVVEEGYYLHVWSLSPTGGWKLVADVTNQKERTQ